ncbi:hypothetical protein D3C78_1207860 [compost metagenome]
MDLAFGRSGAFLANQAKSTRVSTSGISAKPNTLLQPKATAITGAISAASTVPELPAPAMPMALP